MTYPLKSCHGPQVGNHWFKVINVKFAKYNNKLYSVSSVGLSKRGLEQELNGSDQFFAFYESKSCLIKIPAFASTLTQLLRSAREGLVNLGQFEQRKCIQ